MVFDRNIPEIVIPEIVVPEIVVPEIVVPEANAHSDTLQTCPRRFAVRFAALTVSGFPDHRDADQTAT